MRFLKKGHPQRNIDAKNPGTTEWVMGLFGTLFLILVIMFQLQMSVFRASSLYLEDALAASALASALIDRNQYSYSRNLVITNPNQAYQIYWNALQINLGIDDRGNPLQDGLIHGPIQVNNYTIYNVFSDRIEEIRVRENGSVERREGKPGAVHAPNGQVISQTGVYSEISYPMKAFLGVRVMAKKGKLVEVKIADAENQS